MRAQLSTRPEVNFIKVFPDSNKVMYVGGTFAGHNVTDWYFWFKNDKFGQAMVELGKTESVFNDLKQKLTAQYGRPKVEKYAKGLSETAWEFPASGQLGPTAIRLQLRRDKFVKLTYQNRGISASNGDEGSEF